MKDAHKNFIGGLIKTTYPVVSEDSTELLLGWHYEAPDRHVLPDTGPVEHDRALVNGELMYTFTEGKWEFDLLYTNRFHKFEGMQYVTKTGPTTPAVEGLDFSSKPRNEWTMGNWIAHVGGSIRSDHFVTFGSVMAVDMMVQQILKNVLGVKKEGISLSLRGGTEMQRLMLATAITGAIEPITVNPGYNLKKFIEAQGENILTFEQSVVIMDAIENSGGVNIEIAADKAE
ncbi:hypothetical protein pEaSNUABM37_00080 [Erwinia phage pEa_SNUABM_37]|nr:hypothetical protein pEaSNUABM37_00080 [Erwinia phage pEa_SNUABM_37]QXO10550.1 hypothetical protein pEaSNUABM48_00080 [Erwinia phage pEa_SNUABM_48]